MEEIKLKSCPFCGTRLTNEKPSKLYVHEKTGCILDLRAFTEDQLETWNTRKPVEKVLERLENIEVADIRHGKDFICQGRAIGIEEAIKIIKEGLS